MFSWLEDKIWKNINARRLQLIDMEFKGILSPNEKSELEELQNMAKRYLNEYSSLPFDELETLECLGE